LKAKRDGAAPTRHPRPDAKPPQPEPDLDQIRESKELLERIFDNTHILVAYLDPRFNFIRVNRAYAAADSREPGFFVGKNHFDLYPNEENEAAFRRCVRTGKPYFTHAKPFVYPEHPERGVTYWDWSLQPVKGADGKVEGIVFCLLNVTEQERTRRRFQKGQERLRSLAAQVAMATNRERRRIATALHDQVCPNLAIANMHLSKLQHGVRPCDCADELETVRKIIKLAIDATRSLIFDISPPALYQAGIEAAIEMLADRTHREHGMPVKFRDDDKPKPLRDGVRVALFQAARELVWNAVKHAQADSLELSVARSDGEVHLTVRDNGVGFDASDGTLFTGESGGFGLFNIRERLSEVGARLEITSRPGDGTSATVIAPIESPPDSPDPRPS